jgi:hypothetical protein
MNGSMDSCKQQGGDVKCPKPVVTAASTWTGLWYQLFFGIWPGNVWMRTVFYVCGPLMTHYIAAPQFEFNDSLRHPARRQLPFYV